MAVLVLLAVLCVVGTSMSSPANSEQWPREEFEFPANLELKMPWSKEEMLKIFSKLGWSQEDIVIALSKENVTLSSAPMIRCLK